MNQKITDRVHNFCSYQFLPLMVEIQMNYLIQIKGWKNIGVYIVPLFGISDRLYLLSEYGSDKYMIVTNNFENDFDKLLRDTKNFQEDFGGQIDDYLKRTELREFGKCVLWDEIKEGLPC